MFDLVVPATIGVILLIVLGTVFAVLYHRSTRDEAFVRTLLNSGKAALLGANMRSVGASGITATTATISWIVDPTVTSTRVEYGTTTAYGSNANGTPLTGGGTVTAALSGLTTATLYHYRIRTVQGGFTTYSTDYTFTTT